MAAQGATGGGTGTGPAGVDPRFARSAGRWLHAYPRRWRATRTAEVVDLLADLAPTGARRVDLRSGLGLVRAGWATRRREHPPLRPWLAYVLFGRRLDQRYRDWVLDDIESSMFHVRRVAWLGLFCIVMVGQRIRAGLDAATIPAGAWFALTMVAVAMWGRIPRGQETQKHLVLRPGEVVTESARVHALLSRTRLAALPWVTAATAWVAATVVACGTILVVSGSTWAATPCGRACASFDPVAVTPGYRQAVASVAGAALVVGALLAPLTRRRLRRWVPVTQPARLVVPMDGAAVARLVVLGAALTSSVFVSPSLATGVASGALVVAALALPVALVALRVVASGDTRAAAGVEVLRAALGQQDLPDHAVPGFLPATTWLPAGTIAPPVDPPHPAPPRAATTSARGADPYRPGTV